MGNRTRLPDMLVKWRSRAEAAAARAEAERVVERWNRAIEMGRDVWWSPTIRAAIVAGTPWLDVYCPGCNTSRVIDIRTIDRVPDGIPTLIDLYRGTHWGCQVRWILTAVAITVTVLL